MPGWHWLVDHKVLVYWVAAIAPGPLPSYVTGLAPASPGHFPTDVQWNGPNRALLWRSNHKCVFVCLSSLVSIVVCFPP